MDNRIQLQIEGITKRDQNKIVKAIDQLVKLGQISPNVTWWMTDHNGNEVDSDILRLTGGSIKKIDTHFR